MVDIIDWDPAFDLYVTEQTFYPSEASIAFTSSITRQTQVAEQAEPAWLASITVKVYDHNFGEFQALVDRMRGQKNLMRLYDQRRKVPKGTGSFIPVPPNTQQDPWDDSTFFDDDTGWYDGDAIMPGVNAATAAGSTSLPTYGWTPGDTVLLPGDYFQIGQWPYRVNQQVNADAQGEATIQFLPPLRADASELDYLIIIGWCGLFRFVDDDQGKNPSQSFNTTIYTLNLIEELVPLGSF